MKQLILCACSIFLLARQASGQCDLHRQRDEFSGTMSISSTKVRIIREGDSPIMKTFNKGASDKCFYKDYLQFLITNGKISLVMSEESDNCFCQMQKIEFKFTNGAVLVKEDAQVGHFKQNEGTGEQFVSFELTKDELAMFAESGIDKVRITNDACTDHQVVKDGVGDKAATSIKDYAVCMLKMVRR